MFRCSLKSEDKLCAEELGQQCLGSSPAIQESYPRREAPCSHYTMHTIRGSTYADPRCWVARLLLRCTLLFVRLLGLIPCEPVSQYRSDGLSKLALCYSCLAIGESTGPPRSRSRRPRPSVRSLLSFCAKEVINAYHMLLVRNSRASCFTFWRGKITPR